MAMGEDQNTPDKWGVAGGINWAARWCLGLSLVLLFLSPVTFACSCPAGTQWGALWGVGFGLIALALGVIGIKHFLKSPRECNGFKRSIFGMLLSLLLVAGNLSSFIASYGTWSKHGLTRGISNCRQVGMALHAYASDNDNKYPDAALGHPRNANDVYRELFIGGYLSDERIFGCPTSPSNPDGNIGSAPDYRDAVKAGENHWAMTKGLTSASPPEMPLVFESPAVATWPPKWNADAVEVEQPGRVWRGNRVIVGFNDGSVNAMPLEATKGSAVGLAPKANGQPVFPDVHPTPEVLDVEK